METLPGKRHSKREPWNERAVRCVLEHLIPRMKFHAGHATDKLILVNMARHAHPAGCGITVGKWTQAEWSGCSDRTVWDSLRRLREAGVIVRTTRRTAERGSDTYRLVMCQRCSRNTAGRPCQRCSTPTAARPRRKRASGVEPTPEQRELQVVPPGTPVISSGRTAAASPNGDARRSASGGPAVRPAELQPPGTLRTQRPPATARATTARVVLTVTRADDPKQSNPVQRSTAGALAPFKADLPDGAAVGAQAPQSREPPGAPTGETFSNPSDGQLFEADRFRDPRRYRA